MHKPDKRQSWDEYFMDLAKMAASRSKDKCTKVGCVIISPDKKVRSTGYNGFPRGVNDDVAERYERPLKYLYTAHSEENAIVQAEQSLAGCTLYVYAVENPLPPCANCARMIIQVGIKRVVYMRGDIPKRWKESTDVANIMFKEAGVTVTIINAKEHDKPGKSGKLTPKKLKKFIEQSVEDSKELKELFEKSRRVDDETWPRRVC